MSDLRITTLKSLTLEVEELEQRIAPGALGDVPAQAEGIAAGQMAWQVGLFAGQPGGEHSAVSASGFANFIPASSIGGQATGGTGTLNQHFVAP
jgi:hypothetical protein